jgi:hypothetical protein
VNLCFTPCVNCVYDWPSVLTSGAVVGLQVRAKSQLIVLTVSPLCQDEFRVVSVCVVRLACSDGSQQRAAFIVSNSTVSIQTVLETLHPLIEDEGFTILLIVGKQPSNTLHYIRTLEVQYCQMSA